MKKRTLSEMCEDIARQATDGRFSYTELVPESRVTILEQAASLYAFQAVEVMKYELIYNSGIKKGITQEEVIHKIFNYSPNLV